MCIDWERGVWYRAGQFYASPECYKLRHPIFAKMNACLNFYTVEHWDYISQYPTSFQGWKSGPWWTPPHSKEWRRRCPCCWTVPPLWPWTWTEQCPFCGWNKTIMVFVGPLFQKAELQNYKTLFWMMSCSLIEQWRKKNIILAQKINPFFMTFRKVYFNK